MVAGPAASAAWRWRYERGSSEAPSPLSLESPESTLARAPPACADVPLPSLRRGVACAVALLRREGGDTWGAAASCAASVPAPLFPSLLAAMELHPTDADLHSAACRALAELSPSMAQSTSRCSQPEYPAIE